MTARNDNATGAGGIGETAQQEGRRGNINPQVVDMQSLAITIYTDLHARSQDRRATTLPALIQQIAAPQEYPSKQAMPLFKLARFGDRPTARGSLRHDGNIVAVSGIEGDYDGGKVSVAVAAGLLGLHGIEAAIYTTPSHTPQAPRWRVVCPLSCEHLPASRRDLVARLNGALGGILAPESFTLSQAYYFGKVAGVVYEWRHVAGQYVDMLPELPAVYPAPLPPVPVAGDSLRSIPESQRNLTLTGAAGSMRRAGFDGPAILAALTSMNEKKCVPPLDSWEVEQIAASVTRYSPEPQTWEMGFGNCPLPPGATPVPEATVCPAARFSLMMGADIAALRPLPWAIRGVLPAEGVAAVYGATASGKSFAVLDMGQAIAAGGDWFGHAVKEARPVVYCALEGEGGISGRVKAHQCRYGDSGANMRYLLQPFNLLNPAEVEALGAAVLAAGCGNGVVILDTLNRAAPGADENDSKAMGQIIAGAKALQSRCGGLVLLVHHTGKDTSKGLRGHSSLLAALDAAIEVRRDGERREWLLTKSKDGEDGAAHPFRLEQVAIGTDQDGEPLTSCVVVPDQGGVFSKPPMLPKSGHQRAIYDALRTLLPFAADRGLGGAPADTPCLAIEAAIEATRAKLICEPKRQTERARIAISGLVDRGLICHGEGYLWLP